MGTSEAALQIFSGVIPRALCSNSYSNNLDSTISFKSQVKFVKQRVLRYRHFSKCSSRLLQGIEAGLGGKTESNRRLLYSCKCQQAERASGMTPEGGNGTWFVDSAKIPQSINSMPSGSNALEFQDVQSAKQEIKSSISNGTNGAVRDSFQKISIESIEDEAWDLLRESIVYYCSSPIGTIAARDPTCSNLLNYDQVFIRDFIPSGIAFLLKGEYEIVRNFLLHTLQLQVI